MVTDPVCKMEVSEQDSETAGNVSTYEGKHYYFCARLCKDKFDKNPKQFTEE